MNKYRSFKKFLLYIIGAVLLLTLLFLWIFNASDKSISIMGSITALWSSMIALTLPYLMKQEENGKKRLSLARRQKSVYDSIFTLVNFYFDDLLAKNIDTSTLPVEYRLKNVTALATIKTHSEVTNLVGVCIAHELNTIKGNHDLLIVTQDQIEISIKLHDFMKIRGITIKIISDDQVLNNENAIPMTKELVLSHLEPIKERINKVNNVKLVDNDYALQN